MKFQTQFEVPGPSHIEVSFTPPSESGADAHEFDIRNSALNPEEICDLKQRFNRMFSASEQLDPKLRTRLGSI
jgi:hypothetical protein